VELAGFRANPDETKRSWDEYVRTIPKMWTEERFSYDGQYVKLPRRAILPKPYQDPHPPLWVACGSRGTEIDAAERGIGALFLSFSGYKQQEERVAAYRARIARCDKPVGLFIHNRATLVNFLYCHEDGEHAVRLGKRVAARYGEGSGQAFGVSEIYPTPAYSTAGDVRSALFRGPEPPPDARSPEDRWKLRRSLEGEDAKAPEGLCAGDPQQIVEALKGWEATGVDQVGFLLNASEMLPHEQVMESLRLFGREVMPHFAEKVSKPQPSMAPVGVS
jgi:alkanesulfonate monooxygenase SsuD/methylene tetrahydromethanopterin reductase-like flavin-dependent oxidoreductase (luciferase family)